MKLIRRRKIRKARRIRAIKLNYVNEPLIRKDLIKFIEYAHKAGIIDIYLSTNGMLLTNKMSDELKHECGIAHIRLLKPLDFYNSSRSI